MSNDISYSESDMFGHSRTKHVEQYWYKLVRIQAIKLNDRNIIDDRHLQNILDQILKINVRLYKNKLSLSKHLVFTILSNLNFLF